MKNLVRLLQITAVMTGVSLSLCKTAQAVSFTIDFDSLPTLGATNQSQSFADANGGNNTFQGVTFGSPDQFRVTGDDYRVGGTAPNPAFGVPHSGHYFLNNANTPNDNVILTTTNVLKEAWFGRNEYYGYGGGASSVTVTAFSGSGDLGSVTIALPDTFPYTGNLLPPNQSIGNGLPDPMVRMDTSHFSSLVGITGYRIGRVEIGSFSGNWVADDLTFETPVPEPLTVLGSMAAIAFVTRFERKLAKDKNEPSDS